MADSGVIVSVRNEWYTADAVHARNYWRTGNVASAQNGSLRISYPCRLADLQSMLYMPPVWYPCEIQQLSPLHQTVWATNNCIVQLHCVGRGKHSVTRIISFFKLIPKDVIRYWQRQFLWKWENKKLVFAQWRKNFSTIPKLNFLLLVMFYMRKYHSFLYFTKVDVCTEVWLWCANFIMCLSFHKQTSLQYILFFLVSV